MLGVAFVLLGVGMIAVFLPAWAAPIFDTVQLHNYQIEIGSAFVVVAIFLMMKKLMA